MKSVAASQRESAGDTFFRDIVEEYYNLNNSGFGTYWRLPPQPAKGYAPFGPANQLDPRNPPSRVGRFSNGKPRLTRTSFLPQGMETFTRFVHGSDGEAGPSIIDEKDSPAVGKFTHPSAAPDNHLLTVWSPGPANHRGTHLPMIDGGIYLIKDGQPIDEPGQMLLIKNDPKYNEQWPRALVSYERVHGVKEPRTLEPLANDGSLSPHLPEGTPFGLVGTSSLYKRESYPGGGVPDGSVTAQFVGPDPRREVLRGLDSFNGTEQNSNWTSQGAEAGLYTNDDIHAIRILAMEPTTHRMNGPASGRQFHNHANERLRILGEIPVRKFVAQASPLVNEASEDARPTNQPLDPDGNPDTSFLAKIPADVAWTFQTLDKDGNKPAGNLVLDKDELIDAIGRYRVGRVPETYYRLALDSGSGGRRPLYGHQPLMGSWRNQNASRYIRKFQARRSLLVWKIYGRRTDGWRNEDFPTETTPGDPATLQHQGKPLKADRFTIRTADLDFTGSIMPPPSAVKSGKVAPLSDEDRRTIVRWIDLGCPIELDESTAAQDRPSYGWMCDDNRPTLSLTYPRAGRNDSFDRILVGMYDYFSGLDLKSFEVVADFDINGAKAGTNLASKFELVSEDVWQLKLTNAVRSLANATLTVAVRDKQGNVTQIVRTFSLNAEDAAVVKRISKPASGGRKSPDSQ